MTNTTRRFAALAAGVLLLLTACSATDDGGGDDSAAGSAASADALEAEPSGRAAGDEEAAADDASGGGSGPDRGSSVDFAVAAANRQIISTASLRVDVEDLDAAVEEVQGLVDGLGGLVFGEETDLRDGARTHLTLKVPPGRFREALGLLADLGEVQTQTVSTDDVTEQVVDLDSRIATAEASVFRLRALLARAERIADITLIEGQLLARETDLETLRGQRRTIEGQVSLATVDVILHAERTSPPPPADESQTGFVDGLRGGAKALRSFAVGASAVAGAILPWSPLLLVALWLTRRWWWTKPRPATPA